jgi:transposase
VRKESTTTTKASTSGEKRGTVLEVLRELLAEGRTDEVLSLVTKLVLRNHDLEKRLAQGTGGGRKNEGVSAAQLQLLLDVVATAAASSGDAIPPELTAANGALRGATGMDEQPADDGEKDKPKKQPPLRKPLPPHLPRKRNPIGVPAAQRSCPACGTERICIGHDVTEVLELVPAQVIVRQDEREKLACPSCEGELVRAPAGDKVVSGGRLGTRLVAELLVDKYDDGLPLHRQKRRFERMGLCLPISTLADQVTWATDLLRPLWRAALTEVLAAKVMHLDGTGLPVLDRMASGGKRLGTLWGYVGDKSVAAYLFTSTGKKVGQRPGELGPADMLARRTGYTVADASNLFETSFDRPDLIECGCNMHARRRFVAALDRGDTRAALPLAAYKKLYEIEEKIRDLDPDARLETRRKESRPVWDELGAWCLAYQPYEPPSSPLGDAIQYLLNHRDALGRFLDHEMIPLDNGIVERLHVRAALTRKNFLFAGSDAGGERAAIAYTILGCCRLAGVNPVEYLGAILPRLSRLVRIANVPALLPARWKHAAPDQAPPALDPASAAA